MPKNKDGLQQLLIDELQDLYDAEKQLVQGAAQDGKGSFQ